MKRMIGGNSRLFCPFLSYAVDQNLDQRPNDSTDGERMKKIKMRDLMLRRKKERECDSSD